MDCRRRLSRRRRNGLEERLDDRSDVGEARLQIALKEHLGRVENCPMAVPLGLGHELGQVDAWPSEPVEGDLQPAGDLQVDAGRGREGGGPGVGPDDPDGADGVVGRSS